MTPRLTGRVSALVAILTVTAGCAATAAAGDRFDPTKSAALPAETLVFEPVNPAIAMADAYGNRSEGAHGTFGTFIPNFITPMHTHTGAYHGIVIEGEMTNPFAGEENPPRMGPGSYWYVPAGAEHATACVSSTPCKFYFHAESAFDFLPTK